MTDPHPDPRALAEALERIDRKLPAGPWELWTSCSFRRITGPDGKEGGVLHAYNQRSDNHPDLSMPEDQLQELVALRNALPAIRVALAASQPPAVQGWVDVTVQEVEAEIGTALCDVAFPALGTLAACNAIARRRFAEQGWRPISEHDEEPAVAPFCSPFLVWGETWESDPTLAFYEDGEWVENHTGGPLENVTHFMPLPAPPAERASEVEGA